MDLRKPWAMAITAFGSSPIGGIPGTLSIKILIQVKKSHFIRFVRSTHITAKMLQTTTQTPAEVGVVRTCNPSSSHLCSVELWLKPSAVTSKVDQTWLTCPASTSNHKPSLLQLSIVYICLYYTITFNIRASLIITTAPSRTAQCVLFGSFDLRSPAGITLSSPARKATTRFD